MTDRGAGEKRLRPRRPRRGILEELQHSDSGRPDYEGGTEYSSDTEYSVGTDYEDVDYPAEPVDDELEDEVAEARNIWWVILIIGVGATLLFLLVLLIVRLTQGHTSGGHHQASSPAASPASTVLAYLAALGQGNARAALAVSAPPPSTTFLTDAIVGQQQQLARINNIRVRTTDSSGSTATVAANYTFGTQQVSKDIFLTNSHGAWRVDPAVITYNLPELATTPRPTLFGQPISGTTLYLFPGRTQFGSADRNFAVTDRNGADWPVAPTTTTADAHLDTTLSPQGRSAVTAAVSRRLAQCQASTVLEPGGCPQREFDVMAVDGTARWQLASRVLTFDMRLDAHTPTTIHVQGDSRWTVAYQARQVDGTIATKHDDVSAFVDGTVDLNASVPSLDLT
jgi:hypothetical protein